MARKAFTPRKTLVLIVTLLVIGAIVWFANRGPQEPVFEGRTLTWWFTEGRMRSSKPHDLPLTREQLRSLGPDAVKWLGHKAAETSLWDSNGDPDDLSSWDRFVQRTRNRWLQADWFLDRYRHLDTVRLSSIEALIALGPDAAPAIPSLLKAMKCRDVDTRRMAAEAVMATGVTAGDAGWPGVAEATRHSSDLTIRLVMMQSVSDSWLQESPRASSPVHFVEMIEFLLDRTLDADGGMRGYADRGLRHWTSWWSRQPQCVEGVHLMLDHFDRLNPGQRQKFIDLLATPHYRPHAGALVPRLTTLAASSDELTRVQILHALVELDEKNLAWPAQLNELAASSTPAVAEAAVKALELTRSAQREN